MKTCQKCGCYDASITIITKIGGFTKFDLCNKCSQKKENELSFKGIQYIKREIKIFPKNTWA